MTAPEPSRHTELDSRPWTVSRVQAMRYSAVTNNAHRIHYDDAFARREGHERPLVHGPLLGALLCSYVTDACGAEARVRRLSFRNHLPVAIGQPVVLSARLAPAGTRPPAYRTVELRCLASDLVVVQGSAEIEITPSATTDNHLKGEER